MKGTIAIEWPKACTYWNFPCVKKFCKKYDFKFTNFDGCQYGLTSISERTRGNPIKKPWRVACTRHEMMIDLDMTCHGKGGLCTTGVPHAKCQGLDTKTTEGYTDMIVKNIHVNFRNMSCRSPLAQQLSPPAPRCTHSACAVVRFCIVEKMSGPAKDIRLTDPKLQGAGFTHTVVPAVGGGPARTGDASAGSASAAGPSLALPSLAGPAPPFIAAPPPPRGTAWKR